MSINQIIEVVFQGYHSEQTIDVLADDLVRGGEMMTGAEFIEQFVLGILTFHGFVMFTILVLFWMYFVNFLGKLFFNREKKSTVLHDYHDTNIPDFICWDCDQANTGDMADVV